MHVKGHACACSPLSPVTAPTDHTVTTITTINSHHCPTSLHSHHHCISPLLQPPPLPNTLPRSTLHHFPPLSHHGHSAVFAPLSPLSPSSALSNDVTATFVRTVNHCRCYGHMIIGFMLKNSKSPIARNHRFINLRVAPWEIDMSIN